MYSSDCASDVSQDQKEVQCAPNTITMLTLKTVLVVKHALNGTYRAEWSLCQWSGNINRCPHTAGEVFVYCFLIVA